MGSFVPLGCRFANEQELRFQFANSSNMGNALLYSGQLSTSQESHITASKRSDLSSTILQDCRFADAQYSGF